MDKACFFDIDGTLALGKHVFESNLEALKKLREAKVKTFICTGRPYPYAKALFQDLVDGYICANGRYVKIGQEVIVDEALDQKMIDYVNDLAKTYHFGVFYMGVENGYAYNVPQKFLDYINEGFGYEYVKLQEIASDVYMFDLYCEDEKLFLFIEDLMKEKIILNHHHDGRSADATIIGFSKGEGIQAVLDKLGISFEDTYAFGDGTNDLCMFQAVKNRIAMGNACAALKKEATHVTASFDQDGIYLSLVKLGLIK